MRFALGLAACLSLCAQQTGRELFVAQCAGCHGAAGEGSRGPSLKVAALQRANDLDSLMALLRRGIPGTEMPALAVETAGDPALRTLASYVLSLRAGAGGGERGRLERGADL